MHALDIITLMVFAVSIVICIWKGLLNILLKLGALIIATIVAKIFGSSVGDIWFSDLIESSGEGMSGAILGNLNDSLSTIIGTILVFVIFYIVLRIIFHFVSKLVKKVSGISVIDRVLGAVLGIAVAFAFMFIFSELVRSVATVVTYIDPSSSIFDTIEGTTVFKYFL